MMKMFVPESIKNFLRPSLQNIRRLRDLFIVCTYDFQRYAKYSGVFRRERHIPSRGAWLTKEYHVIEKGLALPQPRPGFGGERIRRLTDMATKAMRANVCRSEVTLAIDALQGYRDFNDQNEIEPQTWLEQVLETANRHGIPHTGAPIVEIMRPCVDASKSLDFIRSRRSVRDFADKPVPDEVLENAVSAAQYAPCVCNRQAGRVYLIREKKVKDLALSFQNGNRGFGDITPVVAIITIDQAEMLEPTERYQHWIDGGMFAQNFLLGLHAQGYGACPLNWSAPLSKDRGIRKALGFIPDTETIIMMVAIGALKDRYKVARSERRPTSEVMTII